jgi:hypothetical protein
MTPHQKYFLAYIEKEKMKQEFKLSDEVWHRVVQIIQEALLEGIDCADLLRMVRVSKSDLSDELVLTEEYKKSVDEMHKKLLEQAKLLGEKTAQKLVFD